MKVDVKTLLQDIEFEEFAAYNAEDFVKKRNLDEVEDAIETFVMNYRDKYNVDIDIETVKDALKVYYSCKRI